MAKAMITPDFLHAIEKLGIIPNNTRRIIIDIKTGEPPTIYVESYADADVTFQVVKTLEHLDIVVKSIHKEGL